MKRKHTTRKLATISPLPVKSFFLFGRTLWIGVVALACVSALLWLSPQGRAASANAARSLRTVWGGTVAAATTKAAAQDKGPTSGKPEPASEVSVVTYPGSLPVEKSKFQRFAATAARSTEVEPNNTTATATMVAGTGLKIKGNLWSNGDIDFYAFPATAGDRFYAATMTSGSAGNSTDSQLTLLASDGTTVIEFDDDNGSFAGLSSSIAGATIPTTGTYYLKVNDFTAGTASERGYELWMQLQSGAPTPEVEANDTPATANVLPASGWVSGARNPAAASEQDWYSFNLNAGDTVYLSLDLDPERDSVTWNGRLGFGLFGDASDQIVVVDDAGTGDVSPNPNRPSEAMFMTVKTAGTYFAFVDSASAATGGPTATYHLNVTVLPAPTGLSCTTYTSTDVPVTIGPGTGLVSSTITVPGNPRIADLDVEIILNHAVMRDVDAHLRSPAGNDNGLFTDIGEAATGGQTQMDLVFDDDAGIPPGFTVLKGLQIKPENNSSAGTASSSGAYRLAAYNGENAGGTWTLDLRDDTANASGGTLTSWSLKVCTPPPAPSCAPGFAPVTVFSTDFEGGAAGFTHSGTADEWELGLPATVATATANPIAAFNTCNSGANCWKTDLDNTYNASSNQDLLSPGIDLTGYSAPIVVTWAQRHQIETANFDHMFVDYQQVGGATPVRLYEWLDPTPMSASGGTGNPQVNIGGSYGWGVFSQRADSLAGLNTELRFHLDTDSTAQFGGLAVDDVTITACRPVPTITKAFAPATILSGGTSTVTLTLGNATASDFTNASFTDTLTNMSAVGGAVGGTCLGTMPATLSAGATALSFSGITIPANGSCTVTFAVTSSTLGEQPNATSGVTSTQNATPGAPSNTAILTVLSAVTVNKAFAPTSIPAGSMSTVTLTLTNGNPFGLVSAFTDTLANMTAVGGPVGGSCAQLSPINLVANATALSFSGIAVPALSSCTATFPVSSNVVGVHPNATSGVTTDFTPMAGPPSNTANLTVNAATTATIAKAFSPATIPLGGTSTVSLTLGNTLAIGVLASFTDNLTGMVAVGGPVGGTCGSLSGNTLVANATNLSFSGIVIPASGSCVATFDVKGTVAGMQSNTTSGVTTDQSLVAGAPSNAAVLTVVPTTVVKAFSPSSIVSGGVSTVSLTLNNGNAAAVLASLTDTLTNMTAVGGSIGTTCASLSAITIPANATNVSLSGLVIPGGGSCVVTFAVTSSTVGTHPNTTSGVTMNSSGVAGPVSNTANLTVTGALLPTLASRTVRNDFDGDGKSDLARWRSDLGAWEVKFSSDGELHRIQLVESNDKDEYVAVAADFDGDHRTDAAVWRASDGRWLIKRSSDGELVKAQFGLSGDTPMAADFDGDGRADLAVWRNGDGLHIQRSSDQTEQAVYLGPAGDTPVIGDFNGDGLTDVAAYIASEGRWLLRDGATGELSDAQFGQAGDTPFAADFDGDGKDDLMTLRPAEGVAYARRSSDHEVQRIPLSNLSAGESAVFGDYDGDGKAEPAIWRAAKAAWDILFRQTPR